MINSELDAAFVELMDINDATCGTPQFVMIEGVRKRSINEDGTTNEILLAGGGGGDIEAGGFRAKCRKAEFAEEPVAGSAIQKMGTGKILSIISFIERNGVEYEITAGDPIAT